jgi:preprotein translocase subunit SecG
MYTLVLAVHIILAVTLVGLVLLQQGKGADVGAVVGGGANTVFGVGGASSLLVRMTTGIAVAFMLTSVLLVRLASSSAGGVQPTTDAMSGSVLEGAPAPSTGSTATGSSESKPAEPVPAVPKSEQAPAAVPAPAAVEKVEGAAAPETKK